MIERLGLLDRELDRHHAQFGRETRPEQRGVAYPSTYILDAAGVVVEWRRQGDYRTRESGSVLLEQIGGGGPAFEPTARAAAGPVRVSASLDSLRVARYQRFRVVVDLEVDPGWHLYANPAPEGCTALDVSARPQSGLEVAPAPLPAPCAFDAGTRVYAGHVRAELPLSYRVEAGGGGRRLELCVDYQACSDTECLPPSRVELVLDVPLEEVDG